MMPWEGIRLKINTKYSTEKKRRRVWNPSDEDIYASVLVWSRQFIVELDGSKVDFQYNLEIQRISFLSCDTKRSKTTVDIRVEQVHIISFVFADGN